MFVNLHTLPPGQSMYTLFLSPDKVQTADSYVEEIDVVAPSGSLRMEVIKAAENELADYEEGLHVVGISNQSDGYWVWREEGWR